MLDTVSTNRAFPFFPLINTGLLAAFLALLLVVHQAYFVIPFLAAAVALLGLLFNGKGSRCWAWDWEDACCLGTLGLFSLLWCLDVARTGKWPVGEGNQGFYLPLWPILATVVWLGWRRWTPSSSALWYGAALGCLLAGGIAAYECWILGRGRASNGINAIPFGNLSLLLATISIVAFLVRRGHIRNTREWLKRGLFLLAAVSGLMASILSGTRGSWIVFPVLLWLLYLAFWESLPARRLVPIGAAVAVVIIGASLLPTTGVQERVAEAVDNLEEYAEGDTYSSLGIRLEMWRAGAHLFSEKPLLGWGEGRLEERRDQWVAEGLYNRGISRYDQLHNDMIDTAARRGLVGLASLLLLYGVPIVLFSKHLRRRKDLQGRALAVSGLIVVVAFIGFGLTQSLLRDVRGLSGFLGMLTACWCLLKATPEGARETVQS